MLISASGRGMCYRFISYILIHVDTGTENIYEFDFSEILFLKMSIQVVLEHDILQNIFYSLIINNIKNTEC